MRYALIVAVLLAGCASDQYARDALDRIDKLDAAISDNAVRLAMEAAGKARQLAAEKRAAEAKVAILQSSNEILEKAEVLKVIDAYHAADLASEAAWAEHEEAVRWLAEQGVYRFALNQVLRQYVEGRAGITGMFRRDVLPPDETTPAPAPGEGSK